MSVHVLMKISNYLGKSDKMQGLPSILLLFCNKFDKFNNKFNWSTNIIFYLSYDVKIIL